MQLKRAIHISLIAHGALIALLLSGHDWSLPKTKTLLPIEARLVVKNKNKNLLPKKPKALPVVDAKKTEEKPVEIKAPEQKVKESIEKKVAPEKIASKSKSTNNNYMKALASLSQNFARDIAAKEQEVEPDAVDDVDQTYFDQIYSLIKASFVVPPHLNGPKGRSLRATIQIFLAADGGLIKLDLVTPSGDEHFDKAVVEGTRRVNNFGPVPIFLQSSLRERGVVVDLCPFTCPEG